MYVCVCSCAIITYILFTTCFCMRLPCLLSVVNQFLYSSVCIIFTCIYIYSIGFLSAISCVCVYVKLDVLLHRGIVSLVYLSRLSSGCIIVCICCCLHYVYLGFNSVLCSAPVAFRRL